MTWLDRVLQAWRIAKARPFLRRGARVLDVGSADGALFQWVDFLAPDSLGIDPALTHSVQGDRFGAIAGSFPEDLPAGETFDAVTMLAVLEHVPETRHVSLAEGCRRCLKARGKVIITVPSPRVDQILRMLKALRLIDGMLLEEHHGYNVGLTTSIFSPPDFRLVCHHTFQLGLNNLFVFEHIA